MLPVHGVARVQRVVVQECATEQHVHHADAGVEQQPGRDQQLQHPPGQHPPGVVDPEDEPVEHEPGGEDDPGLKAAPGAVVTVELDVQREQEEEREQDLAHHAEHAIVGEQ